jgi:3-deoxy-D-manno-octulosonate 8-phosphate phosphatase (KDO 8-P phosphatase)
MSILERLQKIKLLAFDLDGVLTNGKILLSENGSWLRQMDMKDGFAIQLAIKKGLNIAVITGSNSSEVSERLNKLGVKYFFQNIKDKAQCLSALAIDLNLDKDEVLFMGDDIPDLAAFSVSGIKACPLDAVHEIKMSADIISAKNGGDASAREIIEKTMRCQGLWNNDQQVSSI